MGETLVTVHAVSDLYGVMRQIRDMDRGSMTGLDYRLKGRIFSGEQRYPFENGGSIKALP